MKTLLTFLLLALPCVAQLKISQYPNTNNLADTQLFIVTAGATNQNINYAQLKTLNTNAVKTMLSNGVNIVSSDVVQSPLFEIGSQTVTNDITAGGTVKGSNVWDKANARYHYTYSDYGAATAAIQAAIDAAANNPVGTGGKAYVPAGFYTVSTIYVPSGVTLEGEHNGFGDPGTYFQPTASGVPTIILESSAKVKGIVIHDYTNPRTAGRIGIMPTNSASDWVIEDCSVYACDIGLYLDTTWRGTVDRCSFIANNVGVRGTNSAFNAIAFRGGTVYGNTNGVLLTGPAANVTFSGVDFELNMAPLTALGGPIFNLSILDSFTEQESGVSGPTFVLSNCVSPIIEGNSFQASATNSIELMNCTNAIVSGNSVRQNISAPSIKVDAVSSNSITWLGNTVTPSDWGFAHPFDALPVVTPPLRVNGTNTADGFLVSTGAYWMSVSLETGSGHFRVPDYMNGVSFLSQATGNKYFDIGQGSSSGETQFRFFNEYAVKSRLSSGASASFVNADGVGGFGIGTNSPAAAFHVGNGGSAIVDGNLTVRGNPVGLYGSLMMNATNIVVCTGAAGVYTNVAGTGFTTIATNGFYGALADNSAALTNLVAGFYRVTVNASSQGANAQATEWEVFTNNVSCDLISFKKTFDNPARMTSSSATGIIYLPANCRTDFRVQDGGTAGSIAVHRAALTIGTP